MNKTERKQKQMNKYNRMLFEQAYMFGLENRMIQTSEECGELIQAMCKYQRIKQGDKCCSIDMIHAEHNLAEEIADVEICLKQLKTLLCNTEEVEHIKAKKLERTKQLLEEAEKQKQKEVINKPNNCMECYYNRTCDTYYLSEECERKKKRKNNLMDK